jgi:prevent-host-death family protein
MKSVNISSLKAHLSEHLRLVRKGEEVVICDRNTPVARILPWDSEDISDRHRHLVARGALVAPRRRRAVYGASTWPTPPGHVSDEAMELAWQQEREDR